MTLLFPIFVSHAQTFHLTQTATYQIYGEETTSLYPNALTLSTGKVGHMLFQC